MTTATLTVHEAGSRIAYQGEGKGDTYKIRIMGWEPGSEYVNGSSGDYSVEGIKRSGAAAWPNGTRMRANHDGFCEDGGDIRRVIARTIDTPWVESDGLYTNMRVSEEWSSYVREYGDIIGLSISAAGKLRMEAATDEDGNVLRDADGKPIMQPVINEDTGKKVVDEFYSATESPYNSIDFVEAPGADGRIVMRLVESARAHLPEMNVREQARFASGLTEKKGTGTVPSQTKREEENSMDEETQALIASQVSEAVTAALPGVVTSVTEALRPSETPTEVQGWDVAEAAIEAGLSKGARKGVYERVAGGMSAADAIAKESEREAEIRDELTEKLTPVGFTTQPGTKSSAVEAREAEFEELIG